MLQNLQAAAAKCHSKGSAANRLRSFDIHAADRVQKFNQRSSDMDGDAESVDDISDIYAFVYDCQFSILRRISGANHQLRIHFLAGQGIRGRPHRRQFRGLHRPHNNQKSAEKITNS